jgi:manganese/zinc/iron transport system permease protein
MEAVDIALLDPVLRGPLFACALMGALGAVIGVLVVLRQQSLVGETLSHACYPGMIVGAIFSETVFGVVSPTATTLIIFAGAGVSSLIAARLIQWLVIRRHVSSDAALSCLLSTTFATGLLLISAIQSVYPALWRSLQGLLMGQAATMRDRYVLLSLLLSIVGLGIVIICRRGLKAMLFDPDFVRLGLLTHRRLEWVFLGMLVLTVIVSIRSMGVVLLSAVLIFPAISARLLTSQFERVLGIAAIIGGVCGFGGVLISHECAMVSRAIAGRSLWIPTGPLIALLLAGCFCAVLFFSPSEGLVIRAWRRRVFVRRCQSENILKVLWKEGALANRWTFDACRIFEMVSLPKHSMRAVLRRLQRKGLLRALPDGKLELTYKGITTGKKLVRLHRLWELYLVEYCGMSKERVHPSAEEMEHILTPEVERELSLALRNPSFDPHKQPIPSCEGEAVPNA